MEAKKSNRADLKNKRTMFFEIGMIIAIAIVLAGFQWSTGEKSNLILTNNLSEFLIDDYAPITRPEPPKPPEVPKPEPIKEFDIVKNTENVVEPKQLFSSDVDPNEGVVIIPMPEEQLIIEPEVVYFAEIMPSYKGGMAALIKFLRKELNYPDEAKANNVQGRVFVEFIVNKEGGIEKVKIKKGVDPLLDNEALRVVNKMPNWEPGQQNNKKVSVCFTIPINFSLNTSL
jgi:protein TonB